MTANADRYRWQEHLRDHPEDEALAERLGLMCFKGTLKVEPDVFKKIVPPDLDGICLPGWMNSCDEGIGNEQEISILSNGCAGMAKRITQIAYRGEVFEFDEAIALFAPALGGKGTAIARNAGMSKTI